MRTYIYSYSYTGHTELSYVTKCAEGLFCASDTVLVTKCAVTLCAGAHVRRCACAQVRSDKVRRCGIS